MSRKHHWFQLRNEEGQPISDANIHIYLNGTTDEATIYSTSVPATAGDIIAQDTWTTNSSGWFNFYIGDAWEESPSIGYSADQTFEIDWHNYSYGENLITNGSFNANNTTGWTIGNDWGISSNRLESQSPTGSRTYSYYNLESNLEENSIYRLSFDILKLEKSDNRQNELSPYIKPLVYGNGNTQTLAVSTDILGNNGYIFTTQYDNLNLVILQQFNSAHAALDNFELVKLTDNGKYGTIDNLQLLPNVFPVDETDSDATENKLISNQQAYNWNSHIDLLCTCDEPHSIETVDENDPTDATQNKTISNYLINKIETDLNKILEEGETGIEIENSYGPEQITNWNFENIFKSENMIINGTFDTDSDWVKSDAAITIDGGKANWSGAQSGIAELYQNPTPALENGSIYFITYTISNVTAGDIFPYICTGIGGTTEAGTTRSTNGTFTDTFVCIDVSVYDDFRFQGNADFDGSIDNVSLKRFVLNNWKIENSSGKTPIIEQDFADFYADTASLAVSCNYENEGIKANTKSAVMTGDVMRWSGYIKYDGSATLEDGYPCHGGFTIEIIDGDGVTSLHTEDITSASSAYVDTWKYWYVDTDILNSGPSATCSFTQKDSRPVAFKLDNFSCKEKFENILIDTETYTQNDLSTSGSEFLQSKFPGDMETVTGDPSMPHDAVIGTWTSLGINSGETSQDSDADEGLYSLAIRPTYPAPEGSLYLETNEFSVDPNTIYKLYYAARTIPSGGGSDIDVIMYDGDGTIVRTETIPSGATTWTDYNHFWQPSVSGGSAKVRFQPKDRNDTQAKAWWLLDDMELYTIPSGSFYVDFEHSLKRSQLYPIVQLWDTDSHEMMRPIEIQDITKRKLRIWLKRATGIACTVTGAVSGS